MTVTVAQPQSPWPHRLAVLLVCATFPLIWIGGLVTTTGAGMAFPDWLTIDGRFFLLYPLHRWLGGAWDQFIEHGHRLYASAVGLLTILLATVLWRREPRGWVRWLGPAAIAGVCLQGLLGGLRVNFNQQTLAMIHGCVGPLFFALCTAIAVFTSCRWRTAAGPGPQPGDARLLRFALATTALAYAQLTIGAWLRHLGAGATGDVFRVAVLFHLALAAAVIGHALYLGHIVFWRRRQQGWLLRPALGLVALVLSQVALGGATWVNKYGWPDWFAEYEFAQRFVVVPGSAAQVWMTTAHVAVGSLVLVTALLLSLRLWRQAGSLCGTRTTALARRRGQEALA